MDIINGKIVVFDDFTNEERSYEIEQITAEFEEDMPNVIGVVRCTGITLESDAPSEINLAAEEELYNEFADVEYNDADGESRYRKKAAKAISKGTGVDLSRIEVCIFHKNCASVPEERSAIPLETEQSSAG